MTNERAILEDGVVLDNIGIEEIEEVIAPGMILAE